jgi:hypothetical protein
VWIETLKEKTMPDEVKPEAPIVPETPDKPSILPNFGKLLSGRLILTIASAICFYMISRAVCTILIQKSADIDIANIISIISTILVVVSNVFTFYFVRKTMSGSNGNGTDQ